MKQYPISREQHEREQQRRLATRMLAAIVALTLLAALWLCVGCADMSRTPSERQAAPRTDDGSRAKWQRQWELLAAAAESPTADVEHERVLDAMEHAAMMRDGRFFTEVIEDLDTDGDGRIDASRKRFVDITDAPDSATSRAGSAPSDNTAPTLARAAEALGELATKER